MIPVDLPSPSTCWRRLQEWSGEECLKAIQAAVLEELDELGRLDWDQLVADATFIRAKKGDMGRSGFFIAEFSIFERSRPWDERLLPTGDERFADCIHVPLTPSYDFGAVQSAAGQC